jgi:hypothetical protein
LALSILLQQPLLEVVMKPFGLLANYMSPYQSVLLLFYSPQKKVQQIMLPF